MLLKEQQEYRLKGIEERLEQQESQFYRKLDHLEDRIRQVNLKFDRIEQLGDRLDSLNNLFDQLKENFDAKLMVFDDKLANLNSKVNKIKQEDVQQLYSLVKKAFSTSKDLSLEMHNIKTKDIRQSEVLFKQELKQSNILGERLQSPLIHQRVESYQKSDRMRSITLEKDKGQEIKIKQELDDEEVNKNQKQTTKSDAQKLIDKYQFTLQNRLQNENMQKLSNVKVEATATLDSTKLLSQQQQALLERTISQDHIPRSKYLNSTNQIKEQLKNLRK